MAVWCLNRNSMEHVGILLCWPGGILHLSLCVVDPVGHREDHEGMLVPEPTGPPHSPAGEEDSLQAGPRQRLQHRET